MTMRTSSFKTARAISRASIVTLRRNPDLLWFPVIAAALHLTLGAMLGLAAFARSRVGMLDAPDLGIAGALFDSDSSTIQVTTVSSILAYVAFQLIAVATAVALTHAALEGLAGRSWSLREAFGRVRERRGAIAGYTVIRAASGLILGGRGRRRRGGRKGRHRPRRPRQGPLHKLARLAWWAATYLAIPVITRENRGALDSIGRSASLFRSTWREGILGRWVLGWLWIPWLFGGLAPLMLCAATGVKDETVWVVALAISLSMFGLGGIVISTIDTIHRAALYVFATEGVIPDPFDVPDLHVLWQTASDGHQDAETEPARSPETERSRGGEGESEEPADD